MDNEQSSDKDSESDFSIPMSDSENLTQIRAKNMTLKESQVAMMKESQVAMMKESQVAMMKEGAVTGRKSKITCLNMKLFLTNTLSRTLSVTVIFLSCWMIILNLMIFLNRSWTTRLFCLA